MAARVVEACSTLNTADLSSQHMKLVEIHAALLWLWPALVAKLIEEDWTVDVTRKHVGQFQKLESPPSWVDAAAVATALLAGLANASDVGRFEKIAAQCEKTLRVGGDDAERLIQSLWDTIKQHRPSSLSEVEEICVAIEDEQRGLVRVRRQGDLLRVKREEEIRARPPAPAGRGLESSQRRPRAVPPILCGDTHACRVTAAKFQRPPSAL
jgi:hypothetical protein